MMTIRLGSVTHCGHGDPGAHWGLTVAVTVAVPVRLAVKR